jgi:phthiocerol/phenolphthiocerol synthesis type-I polyketide synthase C
MSDVSSRIANLTPKQRALLELRRLQSAGGSQLASEPIAVIGIGCRFPGGVAGPDSFWTLLREGVDAITEVPPDRWDIDAYYDPNPDTPGKMYTRWGGFLSGVDRFDAKFFGITPREAASMDPQQRLLLEVSWEALEHAGQPPDRLVGTRTGVFVGMMTNDYSQMSLVGHDPALMDVYSGSGVDFSFAAGRLSYVLGLQGPSMVIATACSSSLVATHLACQSLRAGECQLALAGGVSLTLTPEATLYSCRIRSMAADGRCKTFDAGADGYVRGEGCGIVVLKRLANAVRDGDRILALVRGSAVNHDGKSAGLTVPNAAAQQAVIRAALSNGGVHPSQVGYVEAHGTGTPLGDPIEIRSLWSVLGQGRGPDAPLVVGSVKTNVGHLEAAAGAAGLIKTILALQHREIPPHLHLHTPNPYIEWGSMHLEVPGARAPWPAHNVPAIAGVSSFGLSGMNAHVVVEEAPGTGRGSEAEDETWAGAQLLAISARTGEGLRAVAAAYGDALGNPGVALRDVCYTANVRRSHLEERAAVVGETLAEMRAGLVAVGQAERRGRVARERPKVAFVFPGQGGHYAGMARGLLAGEAVFRRAVEACDAACRQHGAWRVLEWLERGEEEAAGNARVQPVLFAVQVGLAAVWEAWGIQPDAVVGHSMGEVAAAHVAGMLSLPAAAEVICRRSALLAQVGGQGGMLVVELSAEETTQVLAGWKSLAVAARNGPRTTVVTGEAAEIEALAAALTTQGVFCRRVAVDVAAHSAQVAGLEPVLATALAGVQGSAETRAFYSTVTGGRWAGPACDGGYWGRNLRRPVVFWEALQAMVADGHRMFVEMSPQPVLGPAMAEGLRELGVEGMVRASLRRGEDDRRVLLETLGACYEVGLPVNWAALYPSGGRLVDLPTYPWQRQRFWIASPEPTRPAYRGSSHVLPDHRHEFSGQPGTHVWDLELGAESGSYVADHRVEGVVVVPAAWYVDVAVAACTALWSEGTPELEQVRFMRVLALPQTGYATVQVVVHEDSGRRAAFQIASRSPDGDGWTVHVTGTMRMTSADGSSDEPRVERTLDAIEVVRARCRHSITGLAYYAALAASGLDYGPAFQAVVQVWRRDGEALARLQVPGVVVAGGSHGIHPTLLDAGFQCVGAALPRDADDSAAPALPVRLERFRLFRRPGGDLWSYARILPSSGSTEADVLLLDAGGDVVAEASGLRMQPLERGPRARAAFADWFFDIQWHMTPRPEAETPANQRRGVWLVFADRHGVGQALVDSFTRHGDACVVATIGSAYSESLPDRYELDPLDPAGFRQLLAKVGAPAGVIHLWGLDGAAPVARAQVPVCMSVVHLVQALTNAGWRDLPRLWLVTRGSQSVHDDDGLDAPEQAMVWGLGRTIAMEHPELACTRIDLDAVDEPGVVESLRAEILTADREDQVALRRDARYVARLTRWSDGDGGERARTPAADRAFRLETDSPGILERLTLTATPRRAVGPTQVEIEVRAAGLNFLDVLSAMGVRPDAVQGPIALGGECAGTVVAVGEDVRDLAQGDAVIALAPFCFGTHVTTEALLVVRKPAGLSFEQAAAVPVAFLTAYYAIVHLGRIGPGERILIHSASGGTGLAAVQLAQRAGAGIYATAGSAEKREFLRSLGIEHVMDSRSLSFADDVLRFTDGKGVDVVLNSLAGEAIGRGLAVLAPYGRFLEIGKKDIYQNSRIGLEPFQKNLSYFAVDLARLIVERPAFVRHMLSDLVQQFADGSLQPLPVHVLPIADAVAGFHTMARARHTGKIVFTFDDRRNTPIVRDADEPAPMDAARTFLVTGGLGGLGLILAEWLVHRGARHLLLIGRRPPTEPAEHRLAELRCAGATVVVAQADIAERDQLAAALAQPGLPPLGGVIHAAAVLDDSTLQRLDAARMERVMRPKVDGAWHLHELTQDAHLDFFVLFSSAASVMGSPGQAHYSAANAYLDALAHYRRARGQPALSIDWGPWADAGLAAAQANRGERLAAQGMASIPPRQGLRALDHLLSINPVQVAVMPFNVRHWRQLFPRAMRAPFLAQLLEDGESAGQSGPVENAVRAALESAMPALRQSMLETHLTEQISQVLRLPLSEVARETPLSTMGLDSLMALELRNRLELSLGLTLSATLIWGQPTIAALAPFLLEKLELADSAPAEQENPESADPVSLSAVAALSEADAEARLAAKLASLDVEQL